VNAAFPEIRGVEREPLVAVEHEIGLVIATVLEDRPLVRPVVAAVAALAVVDWRGVIATTVN
jgi:hypothetical protein